VTTFKYEPKNHIDIPNDWTPKQARFAWEFLEEICRAIWNVHGDRIEEVDEQEAAFIDRAARGELTKDEITNNILTDDDYPF
jgi:hypothetical protein